MRFGGRLQAAIEVLEDIKATNRPAGVCLADWGKSHRFAGSGDRAVIGNLVYDVLRKKASLSWLMKSENARPLVIANVITEWGFSHEKLNDEFTDDKHAPDNLSDSEFKTIEQSKLEEMPGWVEANIPEWLEPGFEENFSEDYIKEGKALAERPATDLRVNTLKADVEKVEKALKKYNVERTPFGKSGLRIPASIGIKRSANVLPEAAYQKGWFEVQDAGSQVVSELIYPQAGEKILDYCAGAGGKSLAMSALMENKGQIHSYDIDRHRISNIHERLKRAGTRNVQVHGNDNDSLKALKGKMDRVVVDAPCTGSGVWRRRPDTKWKLTENALMERQEEQETILQEAAEYVRAGGYLCYITCSVLPQENEYQIYNFLEKNSGFQLVSAGEVWEDFYRESPYQPWSSDNCTVTLTPSATKTDGFFFAVMESNK